MIDQLVDKYLTEGLHSNTFAQNVIKKVKLLKPKVTKGQDQDGIVQTTTFSLKNKWSFILTIDQDSPFYFDFEVKNNKGKTVETGREMITYDGLEIIHSIIQDISNND